MSLHRLLHLWKEMWALRCLLIVALVAGLAEVRLSFKEKSKGGENFAVGVGTVTLSSHGPGRPLPSRPLFTRPSPANGVFLYLSDPISIFRFC